MADPRRPLWQRVPWFLWIALAVIVVLGITFAVLARGQAVEDVSMIHLSATQLRTL